MNRIKPAPNKINLRCINFFRDIELGIPKRIGLSRFIKNKTERDYSKYIRV